MSGIIVIILISLFFILSYYKSLSTFVKVAFISALTIQFILAKLSFNYTNLSFVILYFLILLLFIINLNKIVNNKYSKIILGSQFLFLIYIAITSIFRGSFINMLDFTKFYFFGSFLFLLIVSSRKKLDVNKINRFIVLFTIFLSFLGLVQYLVPSSFNFFVVDLSKVGYISENTDIFKRVVGLSFSPAHYGNLLALLLIYTIALLFKNEELKIPKKFLYLGIVIGILSIVLTGIRTSLFSLIVGILLLAILTKSKILIVIICLATVALIFPWDIIISMGESYQKAEGFSNPLGRSFQLFSLFESGSVSSESTFRLTVLALQDFLNNPIIGSGDEMSWLQAFSITDAYLLYHLVQFGIMGLLIIFLPYFYAIRRNKILQVILVVLSIQTLTDTGLFYTPSNLVLWIIFGINIRES